MQAGSCLIVLWSGHADRQPEGLHLIARNTSKGGTRELTPEYLASRIARSGATQILLLLDTCYAGEGVLEAQHVIAQIKLERSDTTWFGVLGSTLALERARDGVFVTRLRELLEHGPKDPVEARRWSVHNEGVRGDDVINALIADWSETEHRPQLSIQGDGPPLVMLPNPSFDADAPAQVVEHLLLAAAGRAPDEEGIYFIGREAQLEEIVAWANRGQAGVFLLTGPAGSGKSAIAGRIASLSNPRQRAEILAAGPLAHADPGPNSVTANVHLRGLTVDQAAGELDRQLVASGAIPREAGGVSRNRGDLVAEIRRSTRAPLIVLDGLDEAGSEARPIARDLVSLLAPTARVLVTTRPLRPEGSEETNAAQITGASQTIDLGTPKLVDETSRDVKAYVAKRLEGIDAERMDPAKARRSDRSVDRRSG